MPEGMTDDQMAEVYTWVDSLTLSRPKRNIADDFSDGVLVVEVVQQAVPTLLNEGFTIMPTSEAKQKELNWIILNQEVLVKLNVSLTDSKIANIIAQKPLSIEKFLLLLKTKLDEKKSMIEAAATL